MGFEQRKKIIRESVESIKIMVPDDFIKQAQDPPVSREYSVEQFPQLKSEPNISVGIMSEPEISFSFDSDFSSPEISGATFHGDYSASYSDGRVLFQGTAYDTLHFKPVLPQDFTAENGHFTLNGVTIGINFHWERKENQSFKGGLKLVADKEKLVAINEISVEAYLFSVISSEMSATASLELLKAHAVISRSWLLKPLFDKSQNHTLVHEIKRDGELIKWYERDAHDLFDVCADDHCQRYQGVTRARTANVQKAIEATRGLVLTSHGEICDARFSKACGGVTELFENCWADEHFSYLERLVDSKNPQSVAAVKDLTVEANADEWIRGEYDSFCNTHDKQILSQVLNNYDQETSDFYRWKVEYTTEELSELVARRSGIDFGTVLALEPVERGTSGRLVRLRIVGTKRTMIVGKELEIRRWLSESHLYSSAFVADKTDTGFRLIGAGWGHGVGLCQIGAAVMGAQGYKFDEILYHYFVDAQLNILYR